MSRHPFVAAPAGGMLGWIEPVVETGAKASPLPLERTAVDVQVIGPLAAIAVTQRFGNPSEAAETEGAIARPGERVGPVEIRMQVDAGVAAGDPASPSHPLDWTRLDERRFTVRPAGDVIPNQDFVVGWKVAGDEVRALAHP